MPGRWIFVCPCGFRYTVMTLDRKCTKVGAFCDYCKTNRGRHYMVTEQNLEFTTNWNNKLNCKSFTTIRLHNPVKYCIGATFKVYLKGVYKGCAKVLDVKRFTIKDINNYVSYLDTGYSPDECRRIIKEMYKKKPIDWNTQLFDFCLLQYSKNEKEPNLFN